MADPLGTTAQMIQRGLRLPHLRLMIALDNTGQITGAATQMGMTQPAASRLMAELERIFDVKLYDRHARGIVLTEAGRLLAKRMRATLHDLDGIFDDVALLTSGARGIVRIGTVTGPGLEIVLPIIRKMRITYPEIEFDVLVDTSDKLAEALLRHDVDFYIGRIPAALDPRAVTMRQIGTEPISLAVRREHPLLRQTAISLADCLSYDWVMQPQGGLMRLTAETYLLERGLSTPERVVSTSSLLLTLALVSDSNAIAPIATSVAELYTSSSRLGSNIRLLDIAHDIQVAPYSLIRARAAEPNPAVRRVLEQLELQLDEIARSG